MCDVTDIDREIFVIAVNNRGGVSIAIDADIDDRRGPVFGQQVFHQVDIACVDPNRERGAVAKRPLGNIERTKPIARFDAVIADTDLGTVLQRSAPAR